MKAKHHFGFGGDGFGTAVAHGGDGQISTMRLPKSVIASGANFVDLTIIPPGASIGVHTHDPDNSEIYIFISGTGRMILGNDEFDIEPGDIVINPLGGTHSFKNTGSLEVRLAVIELTATAGAELI